MQIQPVRCLGIVLSLAWFFMFSWQPAYASRRRLTRRRGDSSGVRLIDSTVGPAAKEGAGSEVREASDSNQGVPTLAPKRPRKDAGLTPVDPQSDLQPARQRQARDRSCRGESGKAGERKRRRPPTRRAEKKLPPSPIRRQPDR